MVHSFLWTSGNQGGSLQFVIHRRRLSIQKRFGNGQSWPCSQNWARLYIIRQIRLCGFHAFKNRGFHSSKEGPDHNVQKLTWIRSGRPGQDLAKGIWSGSEPACKNHRARFLAERNQPAASCLLSDCCVLPRTSRTILLDKTSPDLIWFGLTASGFGQMDPT